MDTILQRAARNNALWCDAVCATHHGPGEFHDTIWLNRFSVPRYYPDAVTLTGVAAAMDQTNAIATLVQSNGAGNLAVKDSFQCLDLGRLGFASLFDAEWICRVSPTAVTGSASGSLHWRHADTEADLSRWEQAWGGRDAATGQSRLFLPRLLSDDDVRFIFAVEDGVPVAGGILNRGAGVVGISNVFAAVPNLETVWQALAACADDAFPGLPVVAYDRDEQLAAAHRAGFITIGRLRVWHRPAMHPGHPET